MMREARKRAEGLDEEHPELTAEQMARGISGHLRRRLMQGEIHAGAEVAALRRFVGLSPEQWAHAFCVPLSTVADWEADRRRPEGTALALICIAARHPRIVREMAEVSVYQAAA